MNNTVNLQTLLSKIRRLTRFISNMVSIACLDQLRFRNPSLFIDPSMASSGLIPKICPPISQDNPHLHTQKFTQKILKG